jgi:hypothetical protein
MQTGAVTFENPYRVTGDIILCRNEYVGKLLGSLAEPDKAKQIIQGLNLAFQKGFQEGAIRPA